MNTTRRMYRLGAVLAVAIGAALALTLPANALSVQVKSPPNKVVALEATATFEANGAAVITTLDIYCPNGATAYTTITVTEVVDGTIVQGSMNRDIDNCNGQPQTIRVTVTPLLKPFKQGVAFGSAWMRYFNMNGTHSAWDEHTIRIG